MHTVHSGTLRTGCHYKALLGLGAVLIFCGIVSLAVGIANAVVCGMMGAIGYGIWGAVLCFIAGATGIAASRSRTTTMIVVHMILAIVTAVSATVQLGMGAGSAVADHDRLKKYNGDVDTPYDYVNVNHLIHRSRNFQYYYDYYRCRDTNWAETTGPVVTDALLAAFAIIQGIVAVISSICCCRATVCQPGATMMPWEYGSQVIIVQK